MAEETSTSGSASASASSNGTTGQSTPGASSAGQSGAPGLMASFYRYKFDALMVKSFMIKITFQEFVTRDKISLLLFATRAATIAFTLMFIFPFFG